MVMRLRYGGADVTLTRQIKFKAPKDGDYSAVWYDKKVGGSWIGCVGLFSVFKGDSFNLDPSWPELLPVPKVPWWRFW